MRTEPLRPSEDEALSPHPASTISKLTKSKLTNRAGGTRK
jgi:hypothetical protein